MPLEVNGTVKSIRYYNEANHFMVLSVVLDNESTMSAFVGFGFKPKLQQMYTFTGDYGNDHRFGMQFRFTLMQPYSPSTRKELIKYFASSAFKGIGEVSAEKIVDTLGEDVIEKILNDPNVLDEVGLSDNQVASVLTTLFGRDDGFHSNLTFLSECGLDIDQSHLIYQTYKAETKAILQQDPFRPYYDLYEISFKSALQIANHLEFDAQDQVVQVGQIVHHVRHYVRTSGSTYIEYGSLQSFAAMKLQLDEVDLDRLLQYTIEAQLLMVEANRIYPWDQYIAECSIAAYLKAFPYEKLETVDGDTIEQSLDDYGQTNGIVYDQSQKTAIMAPFRNDLVIITGGPGTGKTSIAKAMVALFRQYFPMATIVAAAPTGRAAKRLSEVLGIHASTLHALLGYNGEDHGFTKGYDHPLQADIVIIDEASMVDSLLFAQLCKAGSKIKKIIAIGDANQLPSVEAGNILSDLMGWDGCTTVKLNINYRQKSDNHINDLAYGILEGTIDPSLFDHNLRFIQCADSQISYHVISVVQSLMDHGHTNMMVASAMHERAGGVKTLNDLLQPLYGPFNGSTVRYGYTTYHIGDTILQTRNDVDQYVFNGDIGKIIDIHPVSGRKKQGGLMIDAMFDDQIVSYDRLHYDAIRLAYAMTIHKMQGNEFDTVVLVVPKCHSAMFTTNLLYTAVTRAKNQLILIGDYDHFVKGALRKCKQRNTTLLKRLKDTV